MTFNDIFKSSFLSNITSISIFDMSLALLLAFGVGMFIFFVYKKTFSGVMYSSSFGVTLIALTMITTLVILAVTSNVVLSLGMVGALSIVRFRPGGRADSAGSHRQPADRRCPARLCQPENTYKSLYCRDQLYRPRE